VLINCLRSRLGGRRDKAVTGIKRAVFRSRVQTCFGMLRRRVLWHSVYSHYDISNSKKVVWKFFRRPWF